MESTKPLAIDSFSYSWLSNVRTSFDDLDEPLRPSFVEPESYPERSQNFNFNVSVSQLSPTLLHADELFADGLIKPFFAGKSDDQNFQASNSSKTCPTRSLCSFARRTIFPGIRIRWLAPARWRKSSVQAIQRCIAHLRPSCFKPGCRGKSTKADVDRRFQELGSWPRSRQPSQPQSLPSAYVTGDWSDPESSIYEAILHCKKVHSCIKACCFFMLVKTREWKSDYMMETGKRLQEIFLRNAKRPISKGHVIEWLFVPVSVSFFFNQGKSFLHRA